MFVSNRCCLVAKSCLTFCNPMTVARQAPLSMEFSRQEYWDGLPFPSPGDLPDPEVGPTSPALASRIFTAEPLAYITSTSFKEGWKM